MRLTRSEFNVLDLSLGQRPTGSLTPTDCDKILDMYRPLAPQECRGTGGEGALRVWTLDAFTRDRLERDYDRPLPQMSDAAARTLAYTREQLKEHGPQTMTDLTELVWGTSGRGSPKLVGLIRAFASLGLLRLVKRGRTQIVSVP